MIVLLQSTDGVLLVVRREARFEPVEQPRDHRRRRLAASVAGSGICCVVSTKVRTPLSSPERFLHEFRPEFVLKIKSDPPP